MVAAEMFVHFVVQTADGSMCLSGTGSGSPQSLQSAPVSADQTILAMKTKIVTTKVITKVTSQTDRWWVCFNLMAAQTANTPGGGFCVCFLTSLHRTLSLKIILNLRLKSAQYSTAASSAGADHANNGWKGIKPMRLAAQIGVSGLERGK